MCLYLSVISTRCSSFEVLQGHRTVDSQGDLCLHRRENGEAGQSENGNMGAVFTPGGKVKQVRGRYCRSQHNLNRTTSCLLLCVCFRAVMWGKIT